MIQRKQSLWLLLTAIITILPIFVPYGILKSSDINSTVVVDTALNAKSDYILLAICLLSSLLAFVCIGFFKNRSIQLKLSYGILVLNLATAAYMIYDTYLAGKNHQLVVGLLGSNLYIGILMPIIALLFTILAISGINADEKLIKSMDRLR